MSNKIDEINMIKISKDIKGKKLTLDLIEKELKKYKIFVKTICIKKPFKIAVKRYLGIVRISGHKYTFTLDENYKVIERSLKNWN